MTKPKPAKRTPRTHFEQVPLRVVKAMVDREASKKQRRALSTSRSPRMGHRASAPQVTTDNDDDRVASMEGVLKRLNEQHEEFATLVRTELERRHTRRRREAQQKKSRAD